MSGIIYLVEIGHNQEIYSAESYNELKASLRNAKVTKYYPESIYLLEQSQKNQFIESLNALSQRNYNLTSENQQLLEKNDIHHTDTDKMQKEIDMLKQEKQQALDMLKHEKEHAVMKITDLQNNITAKLYELEILTHENNKLKAKPQKVVVIETKQNAEKCVIKIFDTDTAASKFQKKFEQSRKLMVSSGIQMTIPTFVQSKSTYDVLTEKSFDEKANDDDEEEEYEYETDSE